MPEQRGRGRPRIEVNGEDIERLAALGLTLDEVASVVGCSPDTLQRRFRTRLDIGWAKMRASIKRAQYDVAVNKKNPTMLIWMGKQYLGQTDNAGNRAQGPGDQLEGLFAALMKGPAKKAGSAGGSSDGGNEEGKQSSE